MNGKTRLNLTVDEDIPDLFAKMAHGRNRMGEYLSNLVRSMDQGHQAIEVDQMDLESLKLMIQGMAGRVKALEGEMLTVRSQVAAIVDHD